jgi:glycerate 2-kinase
MSMFITGLGLSESSRLKVERILRASLAAVDPFRAVQQTLSREGSRLTIAGKVYDLDQYARVRLVGAGKAVYAMARGAAAVLGDRINGGVLIAKHLEDHQVGLPETIGVAAGDHPVPGAGSVAAAQELAVFLESGREDDLVICLISGGGSALMTLPAGLELADLQELTRLLLACGAQIGEINILRKHLDRMKGGGLARMAAPAALAALVLSDVIGNPLDVIASGPTVADASTYQDALAVLQKYDLMERVPERVRELLQQGARGELAETVKQNDPALKKVQNVIVGSNIQAAEAGLAQARAEGFNTLLLTTYLQGEARQAGVFLASILKQQVMSDHPLARPACIAAGGETTVTLRGNGLGGRNQELALGAAFELEGINEAALVTLGTDGEDGPTRAAGALASGQTLANARALGLDAQAFLDNNDSYHFFEALGDLVITGPTGTNVNDLVFLFAF